VGLHLFFLWLPGWFFAAIVYLLLAKAWGADRAELAAAAAPAPAPPAAPESTPAPNRTAMLLGGLLAAGMLALMLGGAIYVFTAGAAGTAEAKETYQQSHELFKNWLWLPTILYFVGALVWTTQRERQKPPAAA
jgi:hypothetical protein